MWPGLAGAAYGVPNIKTVKKLSITVFNKFDPPPSNSNEKTRPTFFEIETF